MSCCLKFEQGTAVKIIPYPHLTKEAIKCRNRRRLIRQGFHFSLSACISRRHTTREGCLNLNRNWAPRNSASLHYIIYTLFLSVLCPGKEDDERRQRKLSSRRKRCFLATAAVKVREMRTKIMGVVLWLLQTPKLAHTRLTEAGHLRSGSLLHCQIYTSRLFLCLSQDITQAPGFDLGPV